MKKNLNDTGFAIFEKYIGKKNSNKLFETLVNYCKFYCPTIFDISFKDDWMDTNFSNKLISLRKNDPKFFCCNL